MLQHAIPHVLMCLPLCVYAKQCCDLGYHASLHRALRTYLSAEQNVETSKHSGLETLEGATENLEANGDKQKLMETYNNVFCPPSRFDFQSHMGDTVQFRLQSASLIFRGVSLRCFYDAVVCLALHCGGL